MAIDGGFIYNLVRELKSELVGKRVEKVHTPSFDEVVLTIRASGFSGRLLISARSGICRIHLTDSPPENPASAPMFCMLLRKHISGAKIKDIISFGLERIVKIIFEARNEMGDIINPSLVVELISTSPNIILLDNDGGIIDSVRRSDIEKNVRIIAPGAKYTLPTPQNKLNPLEFETSQIVEKLKANPHTSIDKAILSSIDGVSPLISRELAFLAEKDLNCSIENTTTKKLVRVVDLLKVSLLGGVPYLILKPDGTPHDLSYMPIMQYGVDFKRVQMTSFSKLLDRFYLERQHTQNIRRNSADILKLLSNLSSRITRKIAARENDLKKCENKDTLRIYGELIKANLHTIKRGETSVKVINYYDENAAEIIIPLNEALTPGENAQKYFKDYKKYCVAEKALQDLIADSKEELKYIESVFDSLSRAETLDDLSIIRDELADGGYIKRPQNFKRKRQTKSKPDKYVTPDGFTILSGKNNLQNDELTQKGADKNDLWFHTKDIHGSHTVLILEGREPSEDAILTAASIAAYHSKASNSSGVAVDYTKIKYVKKPSGARPGMVIYTNNKTLYVTPNSAEILSMREEENR